LSWTRKPHLAIYVMRYEDMLGEPKKTFGALARHLLFRPSDSELDDAIKRSSFEQLKEQEEKDGFRERPEKAERFFREGRSCQWKDVLTPATDQAHRRRSWRADGDPRLYAGVKSRNPRRPIAAGKHILTLIFAEKKCGRLLGESRPPRTRSGDGEGGQGG
jgi:hypothetical protein